MMSVRNCSVFRRILVASDFLDSSATAIRRAIWLTRRCGLSVSFAHCLEHLRRAAHSLTFKAKIDLLSAKGDLFQREIRKESDRKLNNRYTTPALMIFRYRSRRFCGNPSLN